MSLIRPLITNTDDIRRMGSMTIPGGQPWFEYGRRAKAVDGSTVNPSMIFDGLNWRNAKGPVGGKVQQTTFTGLLEGSTRASSKTRFDSAGNLVTLGVNEFDRTYDPATLQPLGLLVEESRTNSFTNGEMQGAVVGVSLPTNFSVESAVGLTTDVVGIGTINGLKYFDVRVSGTPSGTTYQLRTANINVGGAVGTIVTGSSYIQLVGGSLSGIGAQLRLTEATGAFPSDVANIVSGVRLSSSRVAITRTTTLTTSALQLRYVLVGLTIGKPVDVTLRIAGAQLEAGSTATSYIPTAGSTVTRAADDVFTDNLSWLNPTEGTFITQHVAGNQGFLLGMSQGATGNSPRGHVISQSSQAQFFAADGVFTRVSDGLSPPTLGKVVRISATYGGANFQYWQNGAGASTPAAVSSYAYTRLAVGRRYGVGSSYPNTTIAIVMYYPKRLTNAEIQRLTS